MSENKENAKNTCFTNNNCERADVAMLISNETDLKEKHVFERK